MDIKRYIFAWRYRRAVRKARKLAELFGMRYYVLAYRGRPVIIPKQTVKELIKRRRFRPGTTVADIEKTALFITQTPAHVPDRR